MNYVSGPVVTLGDGEGAGAEQGRGHPRFKGWAPHVQPPVLPLNFAKQCAKAALFLLRLHLTAQTATDIVSPSYYTVILLLDINMLFHSLLLFHQQMNAFTK